MSEYEKHIADMIKKCDSGECDFKKQIRAEMKDEVVSLLDEIRDEKWELKHVQGY